MSQNKKLEETMYLKSFLSSDEGIRWCENNKIKDKSNYQESDPLDFIFTNEENQKIGLEVTNFIIESQHGKALQHLMRIGNKVCQYAKTKYNLRISILIDKYDKRQLYCKTYQEMLDLCYNPGFCKIFDQKQIKPKLQKIIDDNVEKLRTAPCLVQEYIEVQNECFKIYISDYCYGTKDFDCAVNNESFSKENPFAELQATIDAKNAKITSYLQKCDKCYLLIHIPSVSKGNYCYFTDKIKNHCFLTKYEAVFLNPWKKTFKENGPSLELKTKS